MNREKPLVRRMGEPMQKGIYVATITEYAGELRAVFPIAEFETLKAGKIWIFVAEELPEFEQYVLTACELITNGDKRIGR